LHNIEDFSIGQCKSREKNAAHDNLMIFVSIMVKVVYYNHRLMCSAALCDPISKITFIKDL
jgi:hypothetical protein